MLIAVSFRVCILTFVLVAVMRVSDDTAGLGDPVLYSYSYTMNVLDENSLESVSQPVFV